MTPFQFASKGIKKAFLKEREIQILDVAWDVGSIEISTWVITSKDENEMNEGVVWNWNASTL